MDLTFGEQAVGIVVGEGLDNDKISEVTHIKKSFAKIIDHIESKQVKSYLGNTLKGMAIRACITASSATVRILVHKE